MHGIIATVLVSIRFSCKCVRLCVCTFVCGYTCTYMNQKQPNPKPHDPVMTWPHHVTKGRQTTSVDAMRM